MRASGAGPGGAVGRRVGGVEWSGNGGPGWGALWSRAALQPLKMSTEESLGINHTTAFNLFANAGSACQPLLTKFTGSRQNHMIKPLNDKYSNTLPYSQDPINNVRKLVLTLCACISNKLPYKLLYRV